MNFRRQSIRLVVYNHVDGFRIKSKERVSPTQNAFKQIMKLFNGVKDWVYFINPELMSGHIQPNDRYRDTPISILLKDSSPIRVGKIINKWSVERKAPNRIFLRDFDESLNPFIKKSSSAVIEEGIPICEFLLNRYDLRDEILWDVEFVPLKGTYLARPSDQENAEGELEDTSYHKEKPQLENNDRHPVEEDKENGLRSKIIASNAKLGSLINELAIKPAFYTFLIDKWHGMNSEVPLGKTNSFPYFHEFCRAFDLPSRYENGALLMYSPFTTHKEVRIINARSLMQYRQTRDYGCFYNKDNKKECNNESCDQLQRTPVYNSCRREMGNVWVQEKPGASIRFSKTYLNTIIENILDEYKVPLSKIIKILYVNTNLTGMDIVKRFCTDFHFRKEEINVIFDDDINVKKIGKKCDFCGNLCSPEACVCPKCGDPFD